MRYSILKLKISEFFKVEDLSGLVRQVGVKRLERTNKGECFNRIIGGRRVDRIGPIERARRKKKEICYY